MKRFKWPLQRLLDVTIQQGLAMRAELFRLSRQIAAVHRELLRRQASLRSALQDFADKPIQQRMREQEVFMQCSDRQRLQLDRLREDLEGLRLERSRKIKEFKETRSSQKTLERLREESLRRHQAQAAKEEQKHLDESSQIAFAREVVRHRTDRGPN